MNKLEIIFIILDLLLNTIQIIQGFITDKKIKNVDYWCKYNARKLENIIESEVN